MGHVKSESFDTDGGIYLYSKENAKNPHGVRKRLGGPFKSHKHAEKVSKEASRNVGEGSIAEYKKYIRGSLRSPSLLSRKSKGKRK